METICRPCVNLRRKLANPLEEKETRLRKQGSSLTKREKELALQNNTCPICQQKFSDVIIPCRDHDHATNQIREFLCRNCNTGIGMLGDSSVILKRATDYLQRYNK